MKRNCFGILIFSMFLFLYSCTVSIDGAPCDPKLNNCPSGQYCSAEGICKRGNPEIRDINTSDNSISDAETVRDIVDDAIDTSDVLIEPDGDIISIDVEDAAPDVIPDAICIDECQVDKCKDNNILLVCKDWDGDGCKEYREVGCGQNSFCSNNICLCQTPYKDCNNDMSDGCETNSDTDNQHCGFCSNDCGANSLCNSGNCGCIDGYKNCNGRWSDGCEVDLNNDPENCGECGRDCGVNTICDSKVCKCRAGYGDCQPQELGCETDFNSPASCGVDCLNLTNCGQNSICNNGFCGCKEGYANCLNGWTDGCEVHIYYDLNNCGECNKKCTPQHVFNPLCNKGNCEYDLCRQYYYDKDGNKENGCEYWSNFPKRYNLPSEGSTPSVVIRHINGYIIAANSDYGIWVFNIDNNGEILWQKYIQLYGNAVIKSGVRVVDTNGALTGYAFAGNITNGNRTDIFVFVIKTDGSSVSGKAFYRSASLDSFDVMKIGYNNISSKYIIAGAFNQQPAILVLNSDLTLNKANFYQQKNLPIYGRFNSFDFDGGGLSLTGEMRYQNQDMQSLLVLMSGDGDIDKQNYFGVANISYYGLDINRINNTLVIIGRAVDQSQMSSGLLEIFDLSTDKYQSVSLINLVDGSSNKLFTEFVRIYGIPNIADTIIIGGSIKFADGDTDMIMAKMTSTGGGLSQVAIGGDKVEFITDFTVENASALIVGPTKSYLNYNEVMAVKLNLSDLTIPDAVCNKSFIRSYFSKTTPIAIPSDIPVPKLEKNDINNVSQEDIIFKKFDNINGGTNNICSPIVGP
ncbi:MAG: hypothetical protein ACP5QK_01225 [Myxococcota bacterium]